MSRPVNSPATADPKPSGTLRTPLLAAIALCTLMASGSSARDFDETLRYQWQLGGFKGALVRIFIPGTGDGELSTRTDDSGHLITELHISSPDSRKGDFWSYGAEIDPEKRRTLRAWSAQRFRGKDRNKESAIEGENVVDLASSIFFLRRERPQEVTTTRIWSSGRLYPVTVKPGLRGRRIFRGRSIATRQYKLRGTGEPFWRGHLDLTLAEDEHATPIEIIVARDGWRVRLELVEAENSQSSGTSR